MLFFRDHGVLEEGTCTEAIRISRRDEHALARADVAHSLPCFGEIRRGLAAFEVLLEVGVGDTRFTPRGQGVGHAENDEASTLAGVEDAGAVAEAAGFRTKFADLTVFCVENLHRSNGVGYFLPVGTDVLHGRAANAARDATQ